MRDAEGAYLARLDTLRAIAVSVVVLFHLKPEALPWGYIGVDMFFSLSGFLMTWLYLRARARGQGFGAGRFIARRFWRIYPPLAVTVLASLMAAFVLLAPGHLLGAAWSGAAALASLSNWVFFYEAGYFDTDAIFKPLLHTWSLGVEEQFYALFAVALLLLRWVPLWASLTAAAVLSLALWGWVVLANMGTGLPPLHDEPFSALFFLPQYRAFQFALGGLAAFGLDRIARPPAALGWIGVALLALGAFVAADKEAAHVSAALVALGMGAVMIRVPLLDRAAELPAVGYLARISYQLYLVHWPVIVFWHYVTLAPLSWGDAAVCAVLCLVLGDLLYRLTNPLRAA